MSRIDEIFRKPYDVQKLDAFDSAEGINQNFDAIWLALQKLKDAVNGIEESEGGGVSDHELLDGDVHTDTEAETVVAGDLIHGNATPKWDRLAKGTDGQFLKMASGLPAWAAHGLSTTDFPHNLLSATHQDTTAAAAVRGDIVTAQQPAQGATDDGKHWTRGRPFGAISSTRNTGTQKYWHRGRPGLWLPAATVTGGVTWRRLEKGTIGQVLTMGAAEPEWADPGELTSSSARAYASTTRALSSVGTPGAITFDAVEWDDGSYWASGAPTRFTVTRDGLYAIKGQIAYPYGCFGLSWQQIRVNGTVRAQSMGGLNNVDPTYAPGYYDVHQVVAILKLNAGDYVELYNVSVRYSGALVTAVAGQNLTWLSIALMQGGGSSGAGSDILPIDLASSNVAGVLPIANGGTGLSSPGSDGAFLKTAGGIYVPTAIAETDIADGSVLARLAANETIAGTWGFTPGLKERGRSTLMGEWISVAHDSTDFTASGAMTWTVDSGDLITFAYTLIGNTMILTFHIGTSSVGGVVSTALRIAIPGGFTAVKTMRQPTAIQDNGTRGIGFVQCVAAVPYLECYKPDLSNWTASANNTGLTGQLSFEVG